MENFNLLKHINSTDDEYSIIWLFNIGVERNWNGADSAVKDAKEDVIVNHIEEINLMITKKQDYMILRQEPGEEFLNSLKEKGFEIPHFLCLNIEDEHKSISELVLEDDAVKAKLTELGKLDRVIFVPYGVSQMEERIALECGLKLFGNSNEKSKTVNNKIFSKKVARDLEFPAAGEMICNSIEDIKEAYGVLREKYKKIIVKMPCNSSGQGMWVIDGDAKLELVCKIINRMKRSIDVEEWLVEGWIEKKNDLNFQVYISENGEIEVFSVKEQIMDGTLYVGSFYPPRISKELYDRCIECGNAIGRHLYSLGYYGVYGIDALISKDNTVVPIIEINGRFTLSTYISFVQNKYPNKMFYAFYKRLQSKAKLDYVSLMSQMKQKNIWLDDEEGIYIYNAATADSELAGGNVRIFFMIVGKDQERIDFYKEELDYLFKELTTKE